LKRYAILEILTKSYVYDYLKKDVDYFKYTIYGNILKNHFGDAKKIKQEYLKLRKEIMNKFHQLHNKEIERLFIERKYSP